MNFSELSFKEKIGQRFIIGINNNNIDDVIYLIKNCYISGVLLYKRNYNNYDEMINVINKLKDANKKNKIPLFIAIDQEGGVVNRLPNDFNNLKNIYDISKTDKKLVIDSAKITSNILNNSGINMNLAPVLDIYNNSKSKVLYKRCFYGNVLDICNCAKLYIHEFKNNNIISVIKHFPGHGVTKFDSHFIVPYIFNYKKFLNKHILPFKETIDNGADCVMLGHFIIRKMTGIWPTSISKKFICKYLRNECNYDGVVITDELNMLNRNILYKYSFIKKAINSDCDILLVKIKDKKDGIAIINKAYKYADKEILDVNVNRIIKLKDKYKLSDDRVKTKIDINKINNEIDLLNKKIISD